MKCICSYLTGVMSEKDFISKYKKVAITTPENQRDILGEAIAWTVRNYDKLEDYAQKKELSARIQRNLRNVTKEECSDKLVGALLQKILMLT